MWWRLTGRSSALDNDASLDADERSQQINTVVSMAHGANVSIVDGTAAQILVSKSWKPPANALQDLLDQKIPPPVTIPGAPAVPPSARGRGTPFRPRVREGSRTARQPRQGRVNAARHSAIGWRRSAADSGNAPHAWAAGWTAAAYAGRAGPPGARRYPGRWIGRSPGTGDPGGAVESGSRGGTARRGAAGGGKGVAPAAASAGVLPAAATPAGGASSGPPAGATGMPAGAMGSGGAGGGSGTKSGASVGGNAADKSSGTRPAASTRTAGEEQATRTTVARQALRGRGSCCSDVGPGHPGFGRARRT